LKQVTGDEAEKRSGYQRQVGGSSTRQSMAGDAFDRDRADQSSDTHDRRHQRPVLE
jgi:hypothetical protein